MADPVQNRPRARRPRRKPVRSTPPRATLAPRDPERRAPQRDGEAEPKLGPYEFRYAIDFGYSGLYLA